MKKFLIVLVAIMAIFAIVGCDNGSTPKKPGSNNNNNNNNNNEPPAGDLEITDAAEIGALLMALNFFGAIDNNSVSTEANKAIINLGASDSPDNNGFKFTFPTAAVGAGYLSLEVTFKLSSLTTITAGAFPKIGFKAGVGNDLTPYDDFELLFDEGVGQELTQTFSLVQPNKLPNNSFLFNHNKYDSVTAALPPASYTLEITKVLFVGGEVVACCTDCDEECADCDAGECTDECEVECCMPPATGTFDMTNFSDDNQTSAGNYGHTYSANTWALNGSYGGQVTFKIGETVSSENFASFTITYTTDDVARLGIALNGARVDTAGIFDHEGWKDLGTGASPLTVTIPASISFNEIYIGSKDDPVNISITKITFTAN